MYVDKAFEVNFEFENPLKTELTDCSIIVDGPGLTRPKKISVR